MLKLKCIKNISNVRIVLPECWHEKIIEFGKLEKFPYEFKVEEIKIQGKDKYYICVPENQKKYKKEKIALSEYAIKYLIGTEIDDTNEGFYFKEYLPIEDSRILITNVRNPSEVIPCDFMSDVKLVEFEDEIIIAVTFIVSYINGNGFADVRQYCDGVRKSMWKFLFHPDESYLTDYEKMFKDTIIHKEFALKSCQKLARYLEAEGAFEHAAALRERGKVHDNSKISDEDELHALSRIVNDKVTLVDPTKKLSPIKRDAIALHWKHNTHHPEHFKSPIDMSKLDIMEMCCDWHARSVQYNTDFLEYINTQQETRFHFPDWMFAEILHYCEVLASKY